MTFTQQYGATGCERMFVELESESIGGSKGGARDARPPPGPNSFIFMQFLAKKNCKIISIWELAHPHRENPGAAIEKTDPSSRSLTIP